MKHLVKEYLKDKKIYGKNKAFSKFLDGKWEGKTRKEWIREITYKLDFTGRYNEDLEQDIILYLYEKDILEKIDLNKTEKEIAYFFYMVCNNYGRDSLNYYIKDKDREFLFTDLSINLNSEDGEYYDNFESKFLVDDYSLENEILFILGNSDLYDDLSKYLTDEQLSIVKLLIDGHTQEEIGEILGSYQVKICRELSIIREIIKDKLDLT